MESKHIPHSIISIRTQIWIWIWSMNLHGYRQDYEDGVCNYMECEDTS